MRRMPRRVREVGLCLLIGLLLLPGVFAEDEKGSGAWKSDLGREEAGALVARAASCSREVLGSLWSDSSPPPARLHEHEDGIPFTVAVVLAAKRSFPALKDLSFSPNLTPRALARALDPLENRAHKHERPSLIHAEYIRGMVVRAKSKDAAFGTVRFAAPDSYEGIVQFDARREGGKWRIVSLRMEAPLTPVTSADGKKWDLIQPRPGADVNPHRGEDLRLPTLSLVGKEPAAGQRVVVSVMSDGRLYLSGVKGLVSLQAMHDHLVGVTQDPSTKEPDGSSKITALLDIDETVPWNVCQWLMQICAHPAIQIYRISFGARARGGLEQGAVGVSLPKDRSGPTPWIQTSFRKVKAKVFSRSPGWSDPHLLYPALLKVPKAERATGMFEIVAPPPKDGRVPWGYIAELLDAGIRAGFGNIGFEGAAMPRLPGGTLPTDPAWLRDRVAEIRKAAAGEKPRMKLNNGGWIDELGLTPQAPPAGGRVEKILSVPFMQMAPLEEEVEEIEEPGGGARRLVDPRSSFPFRGAAKTDGGGTPAVRKAVDEALRWLAAHLASRGAWEPAGFADWCDGKVLQAGGPRATGKGEPRVRVGVTGLALQAFLAAGYTNRGRHPFAKTVSRGLRYLKNVQDPDGCFGPRDHEKYIYNHAMAALAMVEAYGMTGSPIFKGSAQRALDFGALSRNPFFAWRYGVKPGDNDTSVSACMTLVNRAADWVNEHAKRRGKAAPLTVDGSAADGMRAWLEKMTDPTYGRIGYVRRGTGPARPKALVGKFPGQKSEAMTAAGLFSRTLIGVDTKHAQDQGLGLTLIGKLPPRWNQKDGSIDLYYWYWGTLATWQAGGERWTKWEKALHSAVLKSQHKGGDFCLLRGSWDPVGVWGGCGGRVYATAIQCLTLQVYTRYPRLRSK